MNIAQLKQQAAERAVDFVEPGMVVGLGVGSTAIFAVRRLAARLRQGDLHDIVGIPCSLATAAEAQRLGIPLTTLDERPLVDLTIDGADEVDPAFNLIKGGGGALLREKIVAQASSRFIVVADESKLSDKLGMNYRLPVEVLEFAWRSQLHFLESLGAKAEIRQNADGSRFLTDSGNLILDCDFGPIADPLELAASLGSRAGIVEHGLFLYMATDVIIAGQDGVRHLTNK